MKKMLFLSLILVSLASCSCCTDSMTQQQYMRYKSLYNSNERAEAIYLFDVIRTQKENGLVSEKGIEAFEYCIRLKGGVE